MDLSSDHTMSHRDFTDCSTACRYIQGTSISMINTELVSMQNPGMALHTCQDVVEECAVTTLVCSSRRFCCPAGRCTALGGSLGDAVFCVQAACPELQIPLMSHIKGLGVSWLQCSTSPYLASTAASAWQHAH